MLDTHRTGGPRRTRETSRNRILLVPLLLTSMFGAGCLSTQKYLDERVTDFGDCFRLQTGLGPGIGMTVRAGGMLHVGLTAASVPRSLGVGWVYGEAYGLGFGSNGTGWDGEGDFSLPVWMLVFIGGLARDTTSPINDPIHPFHWQIEGAPKMTLSSAYAEHACWSFLPGVLSVIGEPYHGGNPSAERPQAGTSPLPLEEHPRVWTCDARELNPYAHVHAFDIEVSAYAGVAYARAGLSPGEFLDFLLGWFGVDIAGDDRGLGGEEA